MGDTQTISPPPSGYRLNPSDESDITKPVASVRASGDSYNIGDKVNLSGQDAYVTGHDSQGRPMLDTVPPPPPGYSVNKTPPPPSGYSTKAALPPMSKAQADDYFQSLAAGGTKPYQQPKQPSFAGTALVDPESPVFGEPIKSSIHPDTRGGRNLVPVQDVAATRQQMQYDANNPDEAARIQSSQQMDTSLPFAQRMSARAGLEARKRTELGQAVSNVNDQWKQFAGNKGADAGEDFAQFMARNFQTENPQATPGEIGIARSVGKNVASSAVDPVTQATILTGGVGGKLAQATVAALFSAGAAKQSYDAAGELGSIWDRPDVSPQQKAEMASDLFLNTAMAGLTGAHAVRVPFIKGSDPLLSSVPPEYRDAVTQKINSTIQKTGGMLSRSGGMLSRAASTAGDVMAEVGNSDRENVPTQGVAILRKSLPKVSTTSAEPALQMIRAAIDEYGLKTVTASDLLNSPPDKNGNSSLGIIGQLKNEVLTHADEAAGPGNTIADLHPKQAEQYMKLLDALDDVHDHIQQAQEDETAELKKAAEKGKIPATKAASLVRGVMGGGKVAMSVAAGPALGRMSRVLLSAYGIPSGFNDLVTAVRGFIGSGGKLSPTLDDNLNAALARTRPNGFDSTSGSTGEPRAASVPYQGDTSVNHDSLIFPPETPHGDAAMLRDEPNPRFQLSSSSTAARPQMARSASTAQPVQPRSFTSIISGQKPELEPKQIPLTTSVPSRELSGSVTAARQPRSLMDVLSGKQAATEPAAQARTPQSWQETAQVNIQRGVIPDRPLTTTEMKGYLGIPESVGPKEVEAAGLVKRNAKGMWEVQRNASTTQPRDIFPNDKAMEDWLQQQEDNSPRIQQARQRAQRIRDAREAPAQNPGDITVPRGQHPESVVQNALMKLDLSSLREAARAGDIDYSSNDTHQDLIAKIMDAYAGQDEHLSDLAETLQGKRGEIPAGPRQPAPADDTDYSDIMRQSVEAANTRKAAPRPQQGNLARIMRGERRQPDNTDIRSRFSDMTDAQKTQALVEAHQRERISKKTGLPNDIAFQESADTLGQTHPHVGFIDVDDFKGANDAFGHVAVDQKILPAIGDAFRAAMEKEPGVQFFHRSGDEFLARGTDPAAITRAVDHVNNILKDAVFTMQKPDGSTITQKGIGLSHGIGTDEPTAKIASESDKQARKLSGLRTGSRDKTTDQIQTVVPPSPQGDQASFNQLPQRQGVLTGGVSDDAFAEALRRQREEQSGGFGLGAVQSVRNASSLRPGEAAMVPTSDLSTDPARFQYKGGTNEQGVTNALKEQNSYDHNKGGVLLVWKDPANGKVYVVNGHHRFELAERAGEANVLARMIDAPDADTAKVIGAETNISEGHGSTVDAARFFKAAKISTPQQAMDRNLPMGQAKVTDGLAMARLDNSIIDRVESGDIPEGRAVAIGKVTDNPAQQDATLQAIAKREARTNKTLTNGEAESIARQVKAADSHIEQGADLFGSFNREQSLFGEQAEIDDYILRQLRADKRTFGAVSSKSRAEALGKVKNQSINAEENQRISEQAAQAAEVYQKLVNSPGPINEIRKDAAKQLANRYSKPQDIKAKAYERIRQEIQGQLGNDRNGITAEGKP